MERRCAWPIRLALLASAWMTAASADEGVRTLDVAFESHGVALAGSLVLPASAKIDAAVVFVHGSGPQERNLRLAGRFARAGIAALVYDKRGVGASGGEYEAKQNVSGMNVSLLADDAAAALQALAANPELAGVPVGIGGISQAGWIAPLAAERSGIAKFIVLWSAPVCKVSEEDIYSRFTADADAAGVPSYREALASRTEPYVWPGFLGVDTDPGDALRQLSIPGLWIFGGRDGSIPVDLSIERLQALRDTGRPYEHVVFPAEGHDNIDGTFAAAVDWVRRASK
jgi:pimeloyl-ACP methyl ester carboxylesterase